LGGSQNDDPISVKGTESTMAATPSVTPSLTSTDSLSSIASSEQSALAAQEQAYAQQQQIETESAIMQSQHDTMMAVIRAIAQ